MNLPYLISTLVYLTIAIPLIWLTDVTFNGQDDLQLTRLAIYTPIVISSLITGTLALTAALRDKWYRYQFEGMVRWPPDWDYNVAGWAMSKAVFFTAIWLSVSGLWQSEWMLTIALLLFFIGHTMFSAQWLGPDGADRARTQPSNSEGRFRHDGR